MNPAKRKRIARIEAIRAEQEVKTVEPVVEAVVEQPVVQETVEAPVVEEAPAPVVSSKKKKS